jgi:hypothetical protein
VTAPSAIGSSAATRTAQLGWYLGAEGRQPSTGGGEKLTMPTFQHASVTGCRLGSIWGWLVWEKWRHRDVTSDEPINFLSELRYPDGRLAGGRTGLRAAA